MAKCWLCSTKKGKRYCSPLDKVICPICCATNRLKKIDCNEDCRYLSGVALQTKRAEEKEFSELMNRVPHGEHDDIFKEPAVAFLLSFVVPGAGQFYNGEKGKAALW